MNKLLAAAGILTMAFVPTAIAQERTLQLDVNNIAFQARNALGAPSAFGGLTHTGSLHMMYEAPHTELLAVLIKTGAGPFLPQAFMGSLTGATVHIDLNAGAVTGGSMLFDVNGGPATGGDRYSAIIGASGQVSTFVGGGFQIEGLTNSGMFSSPSYGSVNIADFHANQGGNFLIGSFLSFRIQPNAAGAGTADIDVFVSNIPSPGAFALLATGGLFAMRRRRA